MKKVIVIIAALILVAILVFGYFYYGSASCWVVRVRKGISLSYTCRVEEPNQWIEKEMELGHDGFVRVDFSKKHGSSGSGLGLTYWDVETYYLNWGTWEIVSIYDFQ